MTKLKLEVYKFGFQHKKIQTQINV